MSRGAAECVQSFFISAMGSRGRFFSCVWRLSDHARSFIIFYNDPQTRILRFHSFRDYVK